MGLDMYLSARKYFWHKMEQPKVPDLPEGRRVTYVEAEAVTWRKANAIHSWFVENIQNGEDDCKTYFVSKETLLKLVETCEAILKREADPEETLPTENGFFFGSTEYDEWYYDNLKKTVSEIRQAFLDFPEDQWEFQYQSSW